MKIVISSIDNHELINLLKDLILASMF